MNSFWSDRQVVVTGGASFIGSHLVEDLVEAGARVTVIDNFSSGSLSNLESVKKKIIVKKFDIAIQHRKELSELLKGQDIVFHLAAIHGGRGYIDSHPADVCSNLAIDNSILEASLNSDVEKIIMASSACVYPPKMQEKSSGYKLKETDTDISKLDGYISADLEYGWAKVMGEMQLRAFHKQYGLRGASMRFVTAYGPRENETHAIIALIYKALNHQDPYEIWGDGNQDRDFTYVKDITSACLLAAEKVKEVDEFNVGTGERFTIKQIIDKIFGIINWRPNQISYLTSKPTGVYSRALDIGKIKTQLGWEPQYSIEKGLEFTIEWYKKNGDLSGVKDKLLMERVIPK